MVDPYPAHAGDPQRLLGLVGQPLYAHEQLTGSPRAAREQPMGQ
ncbi:hypothetical protein ACIRQP_04955 [Streptomyces sp. NPDC102274]